MDETEYQPSAKALSLTGILPPDAYLSKEEFRKEYTDYLEEKYK